MIKARSEVEQLEPYVAPLEGRRPMLRLDFNENTVGPSPKVVEAIRSLPPDAYATYPEYAGLNEVYAASIHVPVQHVAAFNGVDAAIHAIFDVYGAKDRTFLTTAPTFGYYKPCALQHGMQQDEVLYPADLSFPLETMRERLTGKPRLCFICNPNNPTGTLLEPQTLLELIQAASDTLVVVDELYADFTKKSLLPAALEVDNVVVLRSLSKSAGLAALRLGFAIGQPEVVSRLSRVTGPYDINAFAVIAGKAALADRDYIEQYVRQVQAAKAWVTQQLQHLGVRYFGQGGNYLLVWPPRECGSVESRLREQGILVRNMRDKPVIDGSFRLSIGTPEQMQRFMQVFAEVIASEP